jgi:hypothetical protein
MMGWFAAWMLLLWPVGPDRNATPAPEEKVVMTKDEIVGAAKNRLRELGVDDAALAKVAYGPPPLFDGSRTRPFHFIATKPETGPPGRVSRVICVAVDERDGSVHHKSDAAIADFAAALGLPATAMNLDAGRLFTAFLALKYGEALTVAKGPPGVGNREVGALVKAPSLAISGNDAVLVGWTSARNGFELTRHSFLFKASGGVDFVVQPGASLLK